MAVVARVLIVDDNSSIRGLLRSVLGREPDFELVGEAVDGEEAVRLTQELQPDVIVMDHVMPRMSGLSATRKIKDEFPEVEVVGYTGGDGEGLPAMKEAGAAALLEKTQLADLVPCLRSVIARRRALLSGENRPAQQ